jgi:hypothetical protein
MRRVGPRAKWPFVGVAAVALAAAAPGGRARGARCRRARSVIRRHIDEVKACYEPELADHPNLGGRIMAPP